MHQLERGCRVKLLFSGPRQYARQLAFVYLMTNWTQRGVGTELRGGTFPSGSLGKCRNGPSGAFPHGTSTGRPNLTFARGRITSRGTGKRSVPSGKTSARPAELGQSGSRGCCCGSSACSCCGSTPGVWWGSRIFFFVLSQSITTSANRFAVMPLSNQRSSCSMSSSASTLASIRLGICVNRLRSRRSNNCRLPRSSPSSRSSSAPVLLVVSTSLRSASVCTEFRITS